MKVSEEHLSILRAAITPLDTEEARERYRTGDFPRADAVKDLDKRYRWDLFWASRVSLSALDKLRVYNDAHLDTALRSIVPPL